MHLSHSAAMRLGSVALCLSAILAAPAFAADAPAAPAAECELHVWPSGGIGVHTAGLGVAFGAIGGLIDAEGRKSGDQVRAEAASTAFGPDRQLATLVADAPAAALHIPAYRVVPHDKPLDVKAIGTKLRHSDSTAPCYAELITSGLLFYKGPIYKGTLTVAFTYLKFGAKPKATSSYRNEFRRALDIADPRNAASIAEAGDRFAEIYSQSFKQFASYAAAQPAWK